MQWRLGLDLGTNSIGWCALGLNKDGEPDKLVDMGVRIFSDGREPKTGEPLAVARRQARGIRKNLRRRKQRRRALFVQLRTDGLFPANTEEALKLKAVNPYELRVKGLDKKLEAFELGRALFHLGVRRGFKSNRKDKDNVTDTKKTESTQKNAGAKLSQSEKCELLTKIIDDSGCRSLGEFLWKNRDNNKGIRFVPGRTDFYPLRAMYETEFDLLRKTQEPFFPNVNWDKIKHLIFFQRPLQPQERGKCQFMTDKERTFKAMPSSHKYRILQEVYNLKYYDEKNNPVCLNEEQQDILIDALDKVNELSFGKIKKLLHIEGRFNLETEARSKLNGNRTAAVMRKPECFGEMWDSFSLEEQDAITECLISANEDKDVFAMLSKYELSEEQRRNIAKISLQDGTVSLCAELQQKLVREMSEKRLQFDKALLLLGYDHYDDSVQKHNLLPYYGKVLTGSTIGANGQADEKNPEKKYGKIGNPTVHVALNQTRVVVNGLIKEYGKPAEIVVELSRELKASTDAKKEIRKKQALQAKQNEILNKKIKEAYSAISFPGRLERRKMRLWEELGNDSLSRPCLYCGKQISASELFTKNIEIEHIIPYSRSFLDNESNLTVAHARCNAIKGEHTPYEAFGTNPEGYNWADIMERVSRLSNPKKQARFASDAVEAFLASRNFIERQLNDTRYLSKAARRYITSITDKPSNVWVITGAMTKKLRDVWQIDKILNRELTDAVIAEFNLKSEQIGELKKNRYDHRHHALDAMVIALTDRSLLQKISNLHTMREKSTKTGNALPPLPFARSDITEALRKIVVSFKPDHGPEGKLSKETLLGRIKQETKVPIQSLIQEDIENIKDERIREEFEELIAERGSLKKAVSELKTTYPQISVYKYFFAARTDFSSLKTKKDIETIVDKEIREKLRTRTDAHPNESVEKVLADFNDERERLKLPPIRHIRCKTFIQKPIVISPNAKKRNICTRYLNPEDYFCVMIWEIPPKKEGEKSTFQGQYIRRDPEDIDKNKRPIEKKPHPAARKVCLLHKDDYIEFSQNGIWKKARIASFSATQNKLDIRPIYAAKDIESWVYATNENLLEKDWGTNAGQNFISINVLFGTRAARKITVSPTGKVFRGKNES
ncbi:type II CRISPR RNA-guided endonuclease Cas9 [Treponema sp. OMZ 840]|uniref:type II CRISPR RNA-guided endonuclease Cas9 n=1 Tax=Treponema sp. OMZ 840 TaxID=244313 RepID=UPI003D8E664E